MPSSSVQERERRASSGASGSPTLRRRRKLHRRARNYESSENRNPRTAAAHEKPLGGRIRFHFWRSVQREGAALRQGRGLLRGPGLQVRRPPLPLLCLLPKQITFVPLRLRTGAAARMFCTSGLTQRSEGRDDRPHLRVFQRLTAKRNWPGSCRESTLS